MFLVKYIKKHKLFSFFTGIFLTWFVFLLIILLTSHRSVIFYDALTQSDVSSNYESRLPILRYFLEPIASVSFMLGMDFSWLFLFMISYPVLRLIYLMLKRKGYFNSKKFKLFSLIINDLLYFSFKIWVIPLIFLALIMLFGYIFIGFLFVNRYFMVPIQIIVSGCFVLIGIKIFMILIKLIHPRLTFDYLKKNREKAMKKRAISPHFSRFKREIAYFVGLGLLLLGSNVALISTPFPNHSIVSKIPLANDEFLIDLHVHTVFSDGWLTPEERIMRYISQGISIAAFSDHDNIRGAKIAKEFVEKNDLDFTVLIAEEWTDHENDIHLNYYGINEEIVPLESKTPSGPKAMNISELISYVKSKGGYITVNHYNYDPNPKGGYGVPYTLEQLRDWGVDGFEIINGGSWLKYKEIRQFCLDNNLICMAGSDTHTNEDLNTFIKIRLNDPSNKTVKNIFEELKKNTHETIAIEFYPKVFNIDNDLEDLGFYIVEDLINYFLNLNTFQTLSWISWSSIIYVSFMVIIRKIKKTDLSKLQKKFNY